MFVTVVIIPTILLSSVWSSTGSKSVDVTGVKHFFGEADYRDVRLHWDWVRVDPEQARAFQVYYCEIQSWGPHRCKTKLVPDDGKDNDVINNRRSKSYSVDINGLRMATTYSFEIKPVEMMRGERADEPLPAVQGKKIIVPTKGFSARATLCLPTVSEVDVETGPHFAGRVSVESADGKDECSVDGEPDSSRDTYTLRINHKECGSVVNETTVATFIIVQENLPILTHSTRRFLVLCTFQPDTLTVRAGINLPTGTARGNSQIETMPYENMINEIRQQRQISLPEVERPASHIFLMVILVVCGVIGVTAVILRLNRRRYMSESSDGDTFSITSDRYTSDTDSISTIVSQGPSHPVLKPKDGDVFTVEMPISKIPSIAV